MCWAGARSSSGEVSATRIGEDSTGLGCANDADDGTRHAAAGVTGGLAHEVVLAGVDDKATTDDGVLAREREFVIHKIRMGVTVRIGLEVPQIAHVPHGIHGAGVVVPRGVEMTAGGREVRSGQIALLMNVETVFTGRESLHIGDDPHAGRSLFKRHRAADAGIVACHQHGDRLEADRSHHRMGLVVPVVVIGGASQSGCTAQYERGGDGCTQGKKSGVFHKQGKSRLNWSDRPLVIAQFPLPRETTPPGTGSLLRFADRTIPLLLLLFVEAVGYGHGDGNRLAGLLVEVR